MAMMANPADGARRDGDGKRSPWQAAGTAKDRQVDRTVEIGFYRAAEEA
jgi:hypothetical protein